MLRRLLVWSALAGIVVASLGVGVFLARLVRPASAAGATEVAPHAGEEPEEHVAAKPPAHEPVHELAKERGEGEAEHPAAAETKLTPESCAHIDQWLLEGRYAEVRTLAESLHDATTGGLRDALDFRLGLSLEALGKTESAVDTYRALAARAPHTPAGVAASVGQARVWLKVGKIGRARALLAEIQLRAALAPLKGHAVLGDALHLLAVALTREATPADRLVPGSRVMVHSSAGPDFETALVGVKWDAAATEPELATVPLAIQRAGTRVENWLVTVTSRQESIFDLLTLVAERAALKVTWSADAKKQATAKEVNIAAEKMVLLDLLRAATAAADIAYDLKDGTLSLSTYDVPENGISKARQNAARRALVEATTGRPEHGLAVAAGLELGVLEASQGQLKEAAGRFERLAQEHPRSSSTKEIFYNLGLARAQLAEREAARDAFYRVVDRASNQTLGNLAYLHIGRLHLEEGNAALAARPLRRVLSMAAGLNVRSAAAILLAAAELLDDNPRAAHAAIVDVRRNIEEEPYRNVAALLDALARVRATANAERAARAGSDLLEALLAYREEAVLGPVGVMLAGQAYRDLNLGDEMASKYEQALPGLAGNLIPRMKADLAEQLLTAGKRREALPLLRAVVEANGKRAAWAELKLAEDALTGKRLDECITLSYSVFRTGEPTERMGAIRLMGQAYTLKGDFTTAAQCFEGKPPPPPMAKNP